MARPSHTCEAITSSARKRPRVSPAAWQIASLHHQLRPPAGYTTQSGNERAIMTIRRLTSIGPVIPDSPPPWAAENPAGSDTILVL